MLREKLLQIRVIQRLQYFSVVMYKPLVESEAALAAQNPSRKALGEREVMDTTKLLPMYLNSTCYKTTSG